MHFDASRTRAELGLCPRPVASAVADAVSWLKETGHISIPGNTKTATVLADDRPLWQSWE